jgi:DNA-binding response OmpR family regulator
MKKILLIDESSLFRDYLTKKLSEQRFEVIQAVNGLDGGIKLRSELPDLVIMDYFLSRKSSLEVLQEKKTNPNASMIPVIMLSSRIDTKKVVQIAKLGVQKFFTKPVMLNALLKSVSTLLEVDVSIDETPSIIEAHFNDEILFIEIARGLNIEKIQLLQYKIIELMQIYKKKRPKVLIMFSNIEFRDEDRPKLRTLIDIVLQNTSNQFIKILTTAQFVKGYVNSKANWDGIEIVDNLGKAMDGLLGLKPDLYAHDEIVREKILTVSDPKGEGEETFDLRFDGERVSAATLDNLPGDASVAVVDDDIVIRELVKTIFSETSWNLKVFPNGKVFTEQVSEHSFDLIFLDLMMPEMNGFQVLEYMKKNGIQIPVIIFSALDRKETVVKATTYGVLSYLIKPIKPEILLQKAAEVLNSNF